MLLVSCDMNLAEASTAQRDHIDGERVIPGPVLISDRPQERIAVGNAAVGHHDRETRRQSRFAFSKRFDSGFTDEPIREEPMEPLDFRETLARIHPAQPTTERATSGRLLWHISSVVSGSTAIATTGIQWKSELGKKLRVIEPVNGRDLRAVDRQDHDPVGAVSVWGFEIVSKCWLTVCASGD